jgi:DNA-binding winged helix-turn-helix (wHTH) protein
MAVPVLSFGVFELNGQTGELRKAGKPISRLTGQPLAVLLRLLESPGELVARDELRQRLWSSDTFVDYEHSLNAAVNKLREALGDSADTPRFIETIPRRGYRFIAPVTRASDAARVTAGSPADSAGLVADPKLNGKVARGAFLSEAAELPSISRAWARLLFSLIQLMYLSFYLLFLSRLEASADALGFFLPTWTWAWLVFVATGTLGIPVRLYLLTAATFGHRGLGGSFLKIFPLIFFLDELWALAPFFAVGQIGIGLALAGTAALLFLPFSQRSLLLMGDGATDRRQSSAGAAS